MAPRLRNQQRYGVSRRSGNSDCSGNGQIDGERRGRGRRDAPFDIDCVVVSRVGADGRAWSDLSCANMQVRERSGRMVRFLRVDVEEGRFQEAPEEGGDTENCAVCPHRSVTKSTTKSECGFALRMPAANLRYNLPKPSSR